MATAFAYSNRSDRSAGVALRVLRVALPGVGRVHATVDGFAAAWEDANTTAVRSSLPLWVALGDSLTLGVGASAYDRGWVGQVHERLAAAGHELDVVNLGVSGATTADVLDRQLPVLDALRDRVDLVTLMIGSNDLMNPRRRRELPDRMTRILGLLPTGSVIATLPNPSRVAQRADALIERAARERELVVAELRDPRTMSWRGKLADDHFHPNDAGHAALAGVMGDAVLGRSIAQDGSGYPRPA